MQAKKNLNLLSIWHVRFPRETMLQWLTKNLEKFEDVVNFTKVAYTTLYDRSKHPEKFKKETLGPGPETTIHY